MQAKGVGGVNTSKGGWVQTRVGERWVNEGWMSVNECKQKEWEG